MKTNAARTSMTTGETETGMTAMTETEITGMIIVTGTSARTDMIAMTAAMAKTIGTTATTMDTQNVPMTGDDTMDTTNTGAAVMTITATGVPGMSGMDTSEATPASIGMATITGRTPI